MRLGCEQLLPFDLRVSVHERSEGHGINAMLHRRSTRSQKTGHSPKRGIDWFLREVQVLPKTLDGPPLHAAFRTRPPLSSLRSTRAGPISIYRRRLLTTHAPHYLTSPSRQNPPVFQVLVRTTFSVALQELPNRVICTRRTFVTGLVALSNPTDRKRRTLVRLSIKHAHCRPAGEPGDTAGNASNRPGPKRLPPGPAGLVYCLEKVSLRRVH